jgi:hypothetical protein
MLRVVAEPRRECDPFAGPGATFTLAFEREVTARARN